MKATEDLARQLQKCTGYMLQSFVYPVISCTKLAAFVVRRGAGRKRAGYAINDRTYVQIFVRNDDTVPKTVDTRRHCEED